MLPMARILTFCGQTKMTEVIQLVNPTAEELAEILTLFRDIPGRTCTAAVYLQYLDNNWDSVAVFVAKKDGKIVGFTQAEAPNMLDPKCAWLPFSHATARCGHKNSLRAIELAEAWMKERGATHWKMATVRSPKSLNKLWGLKRSKEVLMEKEL